MVDVPLWILGVIILGIMGIVIFSVVMCLDRCGCDEAPGQKDTPNNQNGTTNDIFNSSVHHLYGYDNRGYSHENTAETTTAEYSSYIKPNESTNSEFYVEPMSIIDKNVEPSSQYSEDVAETSFSQTTDKNVKRKSNPDIASELTAVTLTAVNDVFQKNTDTNRADPSKEIAETSFIAVDIENDMDRNCDSAGAGSHSETRFHTDNEDIFHNNPFNYPVYSTKEFAEPSFSDIKLENSSKSIYNSDGASDLALRVNTKSGYDPSGNLHHGNETNKQHVPDNSDSTMVHTTHSESIEPSAIQQVVLKSSELMASDNHCVNSSENTTGTSSEAHLPYQNVSEHYKASETMASDNHCVNCCEETAGTSSFPCHNVSPKTSTTEHNHVLKSDECRNSQQDIENDANVRLSTEIVDTSFSEIFGSSNITNTESSSIHDITVHESNNSEHIFIENTIGNKKNLELSEYITVPAVTGVSASSIEHTQQNSNKLIDEHECLNDEHLKYEISSSSKKDIKGHLSLNVDENSHNSECESSKMIGFTVHHDSFNSKEALFNRCTDLLHSEAKDLVEKRTSHTNDERCNLDDIKIGLSDNNADVLSSHQLYVHIERHNGNNTTDSHGDRNDVN